MKSLKIILIVLVVMAPVLVFTHELQVLIDVNPPFVAVHSQYSENENCSYAEISIFGPRSNKTEFQVGNTDINGNFSFLPDSTGEWVVKVDDGMGHVKNVKIKVTDVFFNKAQTEADENVRPVTADKPRGGIPDYLKAVFGLSLIFGITGIFYWIKANKVIKNREKSVEA